MLILCVFFHSVQLCNTHKQHCYLTKTRCVFQSQEHREGFIIQVKQNKHSYANQSSFSGSELSNQIQNRLKQKRSQVKTFSKKNTYTQDIV